MTTKAKPDSAAEIAMLQTLSQRAAAWLVGISPRNLREKVDIPRNGDGTHNAKEIMTWANEQGHVRRLDDEDYERVLGVVEEISIPHDEPPLSTLNLFKHLRRKYGDRAGPLAFFPGDGSVFPTPSGP